MTAEAFKPLLSQLPKTEKRCLLEWLQDEVKEVKAEPEVNLRLQEKLIKHITRRKRNSNLNL